MHEEEVEQEHDEDEEAEGGATHDFGRTRRFPTSRLGRRSTPRHWPNPVSPTSLTVPDRLMVVRVWHWPCEEAAIQLGEEEHDGMKRTYWRCRPGAQQHNNGRKRPVNFTMQGLHRTGPEATPRRLR